MSTSKHLKRSKKYHGILEEAGSLKKSDYSGSFLDLFVRFAQLFGRCFCLVVFAMMPDDSYPVMVDSVRMDDGDGGDSEGTKSQQHWRIAQKGQRGSKGEHKERSMSAIILLLEPPIPVCHMSVTVFYRISHVWAWTLDAHCSPIWIRLIDTDWLNPLWVSELVAVGWLNPAKDHSGSLTTAS